MPFSSFMAAALYHPVHGYYASQKLRTGRAGDFFTSVSVGPVFGQIMAAEFCASFKRRAMVWRRRVIFTRSSRRESSIVCGTRRA